MGARDTQFQGFADLLWKDLSKLSNTQFQGFDEYVRAYKQTIARRAYDLVLHAIITLDCQWAFDFGNSGLDKYECAVEEMTKIIPDMTEWTEEEEHAIH